MQVGAAAAVVLWAVLEAFWSLVVVASFGSPDSASRAKGRERRRERDQLRIAVRVASRSFRKLALARDGWVPLETVTPADGPGAASSSPGASALVRWSKLMVQLHCALVAAVSGEP